MKKKETPTPYECVRCGHFWLPRKEGTPKRCAKCKSPYWDGQSDPHHEDTIRAKWAMDGASTLSEAAKMLRDYADDLVKMEKDGWQLTQEIADDYGFLYREKATKKPRFVEVTL